MQQGYSWQSDNYAAVQEIPRLLWNPKFICRLRSCPHCTLFWDTSSPHIF